MNSTPAHGFHRVQLLRSYLRGDAVCPALPLTAVVAGGSRCNLNCRMCLRAVREFPADDPDIGVLQRLLDEGAGWLRYICLDGPGEPLLNPHIFRMVRLCRERGIRTVFSTNATRLDRRMADAVFDSGLDQIVFAVNGTTPEVFEHYHRGACYAAVTRNIRGFLDRKRDRRSPIRVSVQMIRLPLTEPQIPEFYRQWRMPGVDAVRVKTDVVCLEGVCLESRRHRTPPRRPCPRLWMGPLYIEGNGDVYASPGVLYRAAPVGNLRQQPLAAIWNGDRLRAMRAAHAAGNLADLPECRACGYPKPQLPLILGAFLLDPFRTGRLVPRVERLGLSGRLPLYEDRDA